MIKIEKPLLTNLAVFTLLQVFDLILTLILVAIYGNYEVNPFMHNVIANFGSVGAILTKLAGIISVILIIVISVRFRPSFSINFVKLMKMLNLVMFLVVSYNLGILIGGKIIGR